MVDALSSGVSVERRAGSNPAWGTIRISLSMLRHGQQAIKVGSMRQFVSPDRRFGKTVIKVYMKPGHDYAVGWHDWGYGQPLRVSTLGARVASLSARPSVRDPEGARARFFSIKDCWREFQQARDRWREFQQTRTRSLPSARTRGCGREADCTWL